MCAYREKIERRERKTKIERRNEIESKLGTEISVSGKDRATKLLNANVVSIRWQKSEDRVTGEGQLRRMGG